MTQENIRLHLIDARQPLTDAFRRLNDFSGRNMTLFVTRESDRLVGSLTDGDLRRAIIAGVQLTDPVELACRRDCMALPAGAPRYNCIAEARRKGISLLPVLDADRITDLLDLHAIKTALPIDAVLMAGGRGERLRPLTLDTPKPLLPVGPKPIIDHNVDELLACGIDNIYVTVNYLKEQIIEHFKDPRFHGRIHCVEEPRRLGTMGSLALCNGLVHDTVLVMNSDLLTTLDFEQMWLAHIRHNAALTMAAIPYPVSVPFAIIEADGRRVTGLSEKPTYNYYANAGVYMMRRDVALDIPRDEYLDAPDLILRLIQQGQTVRYFPIDGRWIDIGSPDDYRAACKWAEW